MEKFVETLSLKKEFEGHPVITRKYLVKTRGSYNPEHYKKHWLDMEFNEFYKQHDASGLALHEATQEDLDKYRLKAKVELITKPLEEYFSNTSTMAHLADFEEDKYAYYSITEETKRLISWHTVRVLKSA